MVWELSSHLDVEKDAAMIRGSSTNMGDAGLDPLALARNRIPHSYLLMFPPNCAAVAMDLATDASIFTDTPGHCRNGKGPVVHVTSIRMCAAVYVAPLLVFALARAPRPWTS